MFCGIQLLLRKVAHRPGCRRPERLRDRHLGIDLVLRLLGIEDFGNAFPLVAGARFLVTGNAADGGLRGAVGVSAVAADAEAVAGGLVFAALVDAGADRDAHRICIKAGVVLDVAQRERAAGGKAVGLVVDGLLRAGDRAAFQIGVAGNINLEAAIPGLDAALFRDAGVVAVDLAVAETEAAGDAHANGDAAADALLLAVVDAGVLQAGDVEVAAYIGADLVAGGDRAFDIGVAAALHGQLVAGLNMGVGPALIAAVGMASAGAGAQSDAKAAGANRDADAAAGTAVGAVLLAGVAGCQQVDLVVCLERDVVAGLDIAALDGQVAVLSRPGGADADIASGRHPGAGGGIAGLRGVTAALA